MSSQATTEATASPPPLALPATIAGMDEDCRRALGRETLVSERLRARLLAAMIGFGLLLYLAVAHLPGISHGAMRTQLRAAGTHIVALILCAIAFELAVGARIGHLLKRGKPAKRVGAYATCAIEITFPTLAILCWAEAFDAPSALGSVTSLFYLLFILFTVLRLDFRLCVFTGAVAAIQYAAVALILLARADTRALADDFARSFAHAAAQQMKHDMTRVAEQAGERAVSQAMQTPQAVGAMPVTPPATPGMSPAGPQGFAYRLTHGLAARLLAAPTTPRADFLVEPAHHVLAASLYALAGLVAGFVSLRVRAQFAESIRRLEERNRVVSLFGQHVTPAVVEKLLHQPVDQGEVRHVCVMFVDIRNFTAFAEPRKPEEVVDYLNRLFSPVIDIVNEHHGIVNKFLGDGFMAVFGAPVADGKDSGHAVEASVRIIERVDQMNAAGTIPPTRLGIGLHAGEAVTGNVGSKSRKEYTIIGSVVNLASRIEQLNKQFGTQALISETVWRGCDPPCPPAQDLGTVCVKGVETPVRIYKLA